MWEDVDIESIDKRLIEDQLYGILEQLNPRHAKVVMLRNGFECTYKEIGNVLKISPTRASQIESKALRILKKSHKQDFLKLDIPWINKFYKSIELAEIRFEEERRKEIAEWHQKCIERQIAKQKEEKAKAKLRIIESDIPKPEMTVQRNERVVPYFPPFFVKLLYTSQNEPYLHVDQAYGSIDRRLDPETYDRWLKHLVESKRDNAHSEMKENYKRLQKLNQRNSTTTIPFEIEGGAPAPLVTIT